MKRINKNPLIRLAFSTALLLCSALVASAQKPEPDEYPKVEVFVGYSAFGEANSRGISFGADRRTSGDYGTNTGFEASLIRNFSKHFGIKGDFSAHFSDESGRGPITLCTPTCTTVTQDAQLKTRVYNFLGGPSLRRATVHASRPSRMCWAASHTPAQLSRPLVQPSIYF